MVFSILFPLFCPWDSYENHPMLLHKYLNWYLLRQETDSESTNDVMLLSDNSSNLLVSLDHLDDGVGMFLPLFTFWKCRVLLQDWNGGSRTLFFRGNNWMGWIDLVILVVVPYPVVVYRISDEVFLVMQKARLEFITEISTTRKPQCSASKEADSNLLQ